jgi:nicotinate-nucleotide adenylyltransferase
MKKRTIGLLGTSANPLHMGHAAIAKSSLAQMQSLDEVWFVITPLSPHKDKCTYEPIEHRLHLANLTARETGLLGDSLKVSEFEVHLHRFQIENSTVVMLEHFVDAYRDLQPVWLMGADNLAELHTWGDRWSEIMEKYPVAVFARKGFEENVLSSEAGKKFAHARKEVGEFECRPGTWCFIEAVEHPASSTDVRRLCAQGIKSEHISNSAFKYIRKYGLYVG